MKKVTIAYAQNLDQVWVEHFRAYLPDALEWWKTHNNESTRFGVDGTTVRKYPLGQTGKGGKPGSLVFNPWAEKQTKKVLRDIVRWEKINTRDGFEEWHAELAKSLANYWLKKVEERANALNTPFDKATDGLSVARLYKLVDLYVRWMRTQAPPKSALYKGVMRFAHIPLDRKSIATLQTAFNGQMPRRGFSMGDIETINDYLAYQELGRVIAGKVRNGTPILFDVFAWNHPSAKKLYD